MWRSMRAEPAAPLARRPATRTANFASIAILLTLCSPARGCSRLQQVRLHGAGDGAQSAAHAKGNYVRLKQLRYIAAAIVVGAGLVLVGATPAQAAAPDNDTFAGAVTVDSLPFSATVDTTEATTDKDDANA